VRGIKETLFSGTCFAVEMGREKVEAVILAGPGFTKEDFMEFVRTREPELAKKIVLEDTTSIGVSGFQEVLAPRRCRQDNAGIKDRREATLIEDLMKEISMDGKAAYGDGRG